MGRANFKNISQPLLNQYTSDIYDNRVINAWEHVTGGTDIISIDGSLNLSGNLTMLPLVNNEFRTKDSTYIYRYMVTQLSPTGGTGFTGKARFIEKLLISIIGTPTEAQLNNIWLPRIKRKIKREDMETNFVK